MNDRVDVRHVLWRDRRRVALLLVTPLLAAVAAGALNLARPEVYEATATAAVSPLGDRAEVPAIAAQNVASFRAAVRSEVFSQRVSERAKTTPQTLRDKLTVQQLGVSDLVELTFEADTPEGAAGTVRIAAEEAFRLLEEAGSVASRSELQEAQDRHDDTLQALTEFTEQTGLVLPDDQLRAEYARLSSLRNQLASAGGPDSAPGLSAAVEQQRTVVRDLAANVRRYRALASEEQVAAEHLAEVKDLARRAPGGGSRILVSVATKVSNVAPALRGAAVAGVLAFGLLLVGFVMWDTRWRPTPARGQVTGSEEGDAPEETMVATAAEAAAPIEPDEVAAPREARVEPQASAGPVEPVPQVEPEPGVEPDLDPVPTPGARTFVAEAARRRFPSSSSLTTRDTDLEGDAFPLDEDTASRAFGLERDERWP